MFSSRSFWLVYQCIDCSKRNVLSIVDEAPGLSVCLFFKKLRKKEGGDSNLACLWVNYLLS